MQRTKGREKKTEEKGEKRRKGAKEREKGIARDGERRKEKRREKINRRSCTRWPINCAAQPRGYQDCYVSHSCEKLDRWKYLKARQIRVANGHIREYVRPPTNCEAIVKIMDIASIRRAIAKCKRESTSSFFLLIIYLKEHNCVPLIIDITCQIRHMKKCWKVELLYGDTSQTLRYPD